MRASCIFNDRWDEFQQLQRHWWYHQRIDLDQCDLKQSRVDLNVTSEVDISTNVCILQPCARRVFLIIDRTNFNNSKDISGRKSYVLLFLIAQVSGPYDSGCLESQFLIKSKTIQRMFGSRIIQSHYPFSQFFCLGVQL